MNKKNNTMDNTRMMAYCAVIWYVIMSIGYCVAVYASPQDTYNQRMSEYETKYKANHGHWPETSYRMIDGKHTKVNPADLHTPKVSANPQPARMITNCPIPAPRIARAPIQRRTYTRTRSYRRVRYYSVPRYSGSCAFRGIFGGTYVIRSPRY